MAGIYIHIPYCKKACHYCNFHFSTSLKSVGEMIAAIGNEIYLRKNYLKEKIDTIYFGGGTPSILQTSQIRFLLDQINNHYKIYPKAEITLEANPDDINRALAQELFEIGINRISLGVQSFNDNALAMLNRTHSKSDAIDSIRILQDSGFSNITVDLIYGIPGQKLSTWKANLAQITELEIPHLSCYALTIEEKTAFGHWLKSGKLKTVSEIQYEQEYKFMCNYLSKEDYKHYEVSNFAKIGYESQHNSAYWKQEPYIGLGPGAHSYNKISRQFNISNNATYIKALNKGELPYEEEILSNSQIYNEYILTGLRTNKGIDLLKTKQELGLNLMEKHQQFIDRCVDEKLAIIENNHFILTDNALILADSIIVELMIDK